MNIAEQTGVLSLSLSNASFEEEKDNNADPEDELDQIMKKYAIGLEDQNIGLRKRSRTLNILLTNTNPPESENSNVVKRGPSIFEGSEMINETHVEMNTT